MAGERGKINPIWKPSAIRFCAIEFHDVTLQPATTTITSAWTKGIHGLDIKLHSFKTRVMNKKRTSHSLEWSEEVFYEITRHVIIRIQCNYILTQSRFVKYLLRRMNVRSVQFNRLVGLFKGQTLLLRHLNVMKDEDIPGIQIEIIQQRKCSKSRFNMKLKRQIFLTLRCSFTWLSVSPKSRLKSRDS